MGFIKNMKIMSKLLIGFIFIAILSGTVGFFGIKNLLKLDKLDKALYEENVIGVFEMAEINKVFLNIRLNLTRVVAFSDKEIRRKAMEDSKEYIKQYEKSVKNYEDRISVKEDRENMDRLKQSFGSYVNIVSEFEKAISENKSNEELTKITVDYIRQGNEISILLGKMMEFNVNQAKERAATNESTAEKAIFIMMILVAAAVAAALVLGISISLIISRPINKLVKAGERLSVGDINIEIESNTTDEIGILMTVFKKLIESTKEQAAVIQKVAEGDMSVEIKSRSEYDVVNRKIEQMLNINNSVFSEIRKSSEQVNAASIQVAQGSTILAQASTEQSATIEEITVTVGEIASQSKENAVVARKVNELANEARKSAEIGSEQMKNMMGSMEQINEASRSISKIIKVIDDIAFQTNILALNAAVEAARAGSHGKGFAVVAEEVRNLAARSAKAANETTDLIESTISKVNTGTKIASETSNALEEINDKIGKVTEMIEDIASSSGEQATAVAQISTGMSQISGAIQTNSATAEESAAASEELSAQAKVLKESVARFKLKEKYHNYGIDTEEEKGIRQIEESEKEYASMFGKY